MSGWKRWSDFFFFSFKARQALASRAAGVKLCFTVSTVKHGCMWFYYPAPRTTICYRGFWVCRSVLKKDYKRNLMTTAIFLSGLHKEMLMKCKTGMTLARCAIQSEITLKMSTGSREATTISFYSKVKSRKEKHSSHMKGCSGQLNIVLFAQIHLISGQNLTVITQTHKPFFRLS